MSHDLYSVLGREFGLSRDEIKQRLRVLLWGAPYARGTPEAARPVIDRCRDFLRSQGLRPVNDLLRERCNQAAPCSTVSAESPSESPPAEALKAVQTYLEQVNDSDETRGIVEMARGWVLDGWGVEDDGVAPEQLAAAMLMEANSEDRSVAAGVSVPEWPQTLRRVAFEILRLCGHYTQPLAAAAKVEPKFYTLQMWGCVEPNLFGPYTTDEERVADAKIIRADKNNSDEDSYCRIDIDQDGTPSVFSFAGGEFEDVDDSE